MKFGISLVAFVVFSLVSLQLAWSGDDNLAADVLRLYEENRKFSLRQIDTYVEKHKSSQSGLFGDDPSGFSYVHPESKPQPGECLYGCLAYDVVHVADGDGKWVSRARLLSELEIAVKADISMDAYVLNEAGVTLIGAQAFANEGMGGPHINTVLKNIMKNFGGEGSEKNVILPTHMFAAGGLMIMFTARGIREAEDSLENSAESAKADDNRTTMVLGQLEAVGPESVGGIPSMLFQVPNIQWPTQSVGSQEFVPIGASLWIDVENYVAVKHRIEGLATVDGTQREFYIEVENSDFRHPAGCGEMYEPYRRSMRMGGILDDEEMAEMQEAAAQLEEFDKQMASLPADQRAMMENMVGGQMDTLRGLANSGAFEHVQEIEAIYCDPDLKTLFSMPDPSIPKNILQEIQVALVTLGYEPGNTDGLLDVMTQVAISQFQAEQGLNVTGEPSQSLLNALVAAVRNNGN